MPSPTKQSTPQRYRPSSNVEYILDLTAVQISWILDMLDRPQRLLTLEDLIWVCEQREWSVALHAHRGKNTAYVNSRRVFNESGQCDWDRTHRVSTPEHALLMAMMAANDNG